MECEVCGSRQLELDRESEISNMKVKTYKCINCSSETTIVEK